MGSQRRYPNGALALVLSASVLLAYASDSPAAELRRRLVASGFTQPLALIQDPSDRSVQYVVQRAGVVLVLRNGALQPVPFLNLTDVVRSSGGEQGLLGLAFPSDYATSGRFYVNFTDKVGVGNTVVARFKRSAANPLVADPATRFDLRWGGPAGPTSIVQPFANHNGGNMAFGPDGYLYIGLGDGGSANDPGNRAQSLQELLGKMLRIDVSVPDADSRGYRVPADNPFVGNAAYRPEIWALGLRNPWRFSFDDPARGGTGALIIGDVGQGEWEEVDYQPAGRGGLNYGWRNREGAHDYITTTPPASPLTDPIHEYNHGAGISITGGFVYRGQALGPAYHGRYFFADFGSGRVWSLGLTIDATGNARVANVVDHSVDLGGSNVSSFGVDAKGELYIVDYRGNIFAIEGGHPAVAGDVDGDSLTDLMIWRPGDGVWYSLESRSHYTTAAGVQHGSAGDVPLMGDIDGDGVRDLITWRPSTGAWSWVTSSTQFQSGGSKAWGNASLGDVPLAGDVDGDDRIDLIVWRASTGTFFWLPSSAGYAYVSARSKQWGNASLGDTPLIGDFDGDGRSDLAVWRASTGTFYWLLAAQNFDYAAARGVQWGNGPLGDVPFLGDLDGDGQADLIVWRASTGVWFWLPSTTQYAHAAVRAIAWGDASMGDVPLLGDFDGDLRADMGVWRATTGTWYCLTSSTGYAPFAPIVRQWGHAGFGDTPVIK